MHMWPERLVVEPRGSWEVNCSTSCTQPEMGGLETTLTKTLLDSQPQWKRYLISNVSEDTDLQCYFLCAGKHQSKHLSITVYQPPEQVVLKLQPTWVAVGNSFTIECRVPAVEPLESLTLILLHGNKTLHNQTFEGRAAVPQEATATLSSTAHLEDRKHNFSCLAQLDLRSRGGGIFHWVSEPQMLEIYGEGVPRTVGFHIGHLLSASQGKTKPEPPSPEPAWDTSTQDPTLNLEHSRGWQSSTCCLAISELCDQVHLLSGLGLSLQ